MPCFGGPWKGTIPTGLFPGSPTDTVRTSITRRGPSSFPPQPETTARNASGRTIQLPLIPASDSMNRHPSSLSDIAVATSRSRVAEDGIDHTVHEALCLLLVVGLEVRRRHL